MKTKIVTLLLLLCSLPFVMGGELEQFEIVKGAGLAKFLATQKEVEADKGKSMNSLKYGIILIGISYVTGFMDCSIDESGQVDNMPYLLPKDITPRDICSVARNYLADHPEKADLPSGVIITLALKGIYPNPNFKPR